MSLYWYLYPCVCTRLLACISIAAIANTQNEQIYSIRKKKSSGLIQMYWEYYME